MFINNQQIVFFVFILLFLRKNAAGLMENFAAISFKKEHGKMNIFDEKRARALCLSKTIGLQLQNPLLLSSKLNNGLGYKSVRIFASRHQNKPECSKQFSKKEQTLTFELSMHLMPCGVQSKRLTFPKAGIEFSVDVILSFGDFSGMTEDDQIFQIRCNFLAESDHTVSVGAALEISTYSKSFLTATNDEVQWAKKTPPHCKYSIHWQTLDGPVIQSAKLGEKVFHKWKCDDDRLALKVYQCFVDDGSNNKRYHLIDENGCSKDANLMPNLIYQDNSSTVYIASRVFKFTESSRIFFNCLLYICPRADLDCRRTVPPKCQQAQQKGGGNVNLVEGSIELAAQHRFRLIRSANENERKNVGLDMFASLSLTPTTAVSSGNKALSSSSPTIENISVDEDVPPESATRSLLCKEDTDDIIGDREKRRLVTALDRAHRVVKLLVAFNCVTLLFTATITILSCRSRFKARVKISDSIR